MRLLKPYTPRYDVCIICGKECKEEACPGSCSVKLEALRNAVQNQIATDKAHGRGGLWNDISIRKYNELMKILDK